MMVGKLLVLRPLRIITLKDIDFIHYNYSIDGKLRPTEWETASRILGRLGISFTKVTEIPLIQKNQISICFDYEGEGFEFTAGLTNDTGKFFAEIESIE